MNLRALLILGLLAGCDSKPAPLYVIADAEKRAAEHPATFEIPPREARQACKFGDIVKIILELPPGAPPRSAGTGERPWFKVRQVKPGPRYVGALDNVPAVFTELMLGDLIEFGPENIIQIWEDPKK